MATQIRRPVVPTPKRDVSPLGASRFEKPFSPQRAPRTSDTSTPLSSPEPPEISKLFAADSHASTDTLPSTVDAPAPNHYSKPSVASTVPTYSTEPTSIDKLDNKELEDHAGLARAEADMAAREAWFLKQTEEEHDLPVDEGDECPDGATLAAVQDIPIYDADGNAIPFRSLYDPEVAMHQRQLIIFVRHFYCGACQAFVKALTDGITIEDYYSIPKPTSIVIIGCGKPDLIPQYRKFTNGCQYSILAEPTRVLFKKLGMKWSMSLGSERPQYMKDISVLDVVKGQVRDVSGAVRDADGIRKRDVFRGGNPLQIGGEFLFEEGEVIWCHRMKHMRGHAEISVLRKLLELDE